MDSTAQIGMQLSPPFDGLDSLSQKSAIQSEIDRVESLSIPEAFKEAKQMRLDQLTKMLNRAMH